MRIQNNFEERFIKIVQWLTIFIKDWTEKDCMIDTRVVRSIVIINLIPNTIGDSLFLTPVFSILKRNFPNVQLAVTASPVSYELFENHPDLDRIIIIPELTELAKDLSKWRKAILYARIMLRLRKELHQYDLAIIPQPNFWFSQVIPKFVGIQQSVGYDYPGARLKFWLTETVPFADPVTFPKRHYLESNLDLLKPLHVKYLRKDLRVLKVVTKRERQNVKKFVNTKAKLVCMQAGAKWKRKQWPSEYFAEVAQTLAREGCVVALLGSMSEVTLNDRIKNGNSAILNLAGRLSLAQVAALLERAEVIIGNDSGLAHLAVAVGTPAITIYGSTSLEHSKPLGTGRAIPVFAGKVPAKLHTIDSDEAAALMRKIPPSRVLKVALRVLKL